MRVFRELTDRVSTSFNVIITIIIIGYPLFIRRCHISEWPSSPEVSGRAVATSVEADRKEEREREGSEKKRLGGGVTSPPSLGSKTSRQLCNTYTYTHKVFRYMKIEYRNARLSPNNLSLSLSPRAPLAWRLPLGHYTLTLCILVYTPGPCYVWALLIIVSSAVIFSCHTRTYLLQVYIDILVR